MGSEGKSRKRHPSPSPPPPLPEDDERSRKHRKTGEGARKSREYGGKEKKRDKKSHKHSKGREAEKKSTKKHKHSKKNSDTFQELSEADYFSKNNEFSTWLKEERGKYFSDLSSDAARELFSSFVKKWNNQKLQAKYYEGIASAPRTDHNWRIKHDK